MKEIYTKEVAEKLRDPNVKLIDVRPVDAYNGWPLKEENRGGHITGAKSFPAKWFRYMDWVEMAAQKGLSHGDELILYGYDRASVLNAAERFEASGYSQVSIYPRFLEEWVPDSRLPMDHLERFSHLVYADWVKELFAGGNPTLYDNGRFVLVHAHYRNRDAYLNGHIPGAVDMDTNAMEDTTTWNRRSPAELRKTLEEHGITSDTTVVLYGKFMNPDNRDPFPGSAAGDIGAIRLAFLMMYAGVADVRILNGGFQSWVDAGYEISTDDVPKQPAQDFGEDIPANPELAVDTPQAREMLRSDSSELVCVRSWPEYIGEVSGYHYIEPKGRIPGAVFADCGTDAYHMENYRNFDHTIREYHETAENWSKRGITPDKHLAFYCGTGWRGSEAWFNAWLMGWPRVSVYDGGWFEWSADPANPFETGVPAEIQL